MKFWLDSGPIRVTRPTPSRPRVQQNNLIGWLMDRSRYGEGRPGFGEGRPGVGTTEFFKLGSCTVSCARCDWYFSFFSLKDSEIYLSKLYADHVPSIICTFIWKNIHEEKWLYDKLSALNESWKNFPFEI